MLLKILIAAVCSRPHPSQLTDTVETRMTAHVVHSSRLHPRDARLEDLERSKEYPHRFFIRPQDHTAQVIWEETAENGSTRLCGPAAHRLCSTHSKHPCYLRFKNHSSHRVRILWLDYNGNEIAYEFIEPNKTAMQQTFTTHPWIAREVTTCTQLLINGSEAFIPSQPMLERQRRAAAAAAAAAAARAAAAAGVAGNAPAGEAEQQQQDPVQQLQHRGIPVIDVEIGELPQLIWTKHVHSFFPDWFKINIKTFLLCHNRLQQTVTYMPVAGTNEGRAHLGHLPSLLLPHITALAAPATPQGVHFEAVARTDIKPTMLPEPPQAADDSLQAETAPAGAEGVDDMEQ